MSKKEKKGLKFLEFKDKQFDGPYEVCGIDIHNEGNVFKGVLYYPPISYKKPYPLVINFHGFPQLFTLQEIVKNHKFLLDMGYAFIAFNFRGYRYSEGKVSIKSQVSDGLKIVEFVKQMVKNDIFALNDINIIAHDFGAYIGLILCSKIKIINKLLLLSPILDLKRHVYSQEFSKTLGYINRFLPGNVRGITNIDEFIEMTKNELSQEEFQIEKVIVELKNKKLKIIIGEEDKITPISEVNEILKNTNIAPEVIIIECMDHDCIEYNEIKEIYEEIKKFFG